MNVSSLGFDSYSRLIIQESWLEQWGKQQIRDSKNQFLFNVLQEDSSVKLDAFINFCEGY